MSRFPVWIVAVVLVVGSMGCEQRQRPNLLVGTWRHSAETAVVTMTFDKDGRFHGDAVPKVGETWKFGGTWKLEGRLLIYTYTESSLARIQPGLIDKDIIIELNAGILTIEALDGMRRTYGRVEE